MPGQPTSPTVSSSDSIEEEYAAMSSSSLDSLGESCDDPADTMQIPDAIVSADEQVHPTPDSKPLPRTNTHSEETTDGTSEHGECKCSRLLSRAGRARRCFANVCLCVFAAWIQYPSIACIKEEIRAGYCSLPTLYCILGQL